MEMLPPDIELLLASCTGDLATVERLLEQDPGLLEVRDPRQAWTPLLMASGCSGGHRDIVLFLLDRGAVIDAQSDIGFTPLLLACTCGNTSVVRLLIDRGADPTIAEARGVLPLHLASSTGNLENIRILLGHSSGSATINHRGPSGSTPIMCAGAYGRVEAVKLLLERGADPTITNDNGLTCMEVCYTFGFPPGVTVKGRVRCIEALKV
jgi:uncharacterized protein